MPAVTLKGHLCSGHETWPPRASIEGEPRFTVSNEQLHLQGHGWGSHCSTKDPFPCHDGKLKAGSQRFTVKGKQVGRVGDPVDCGSTVAQGEERFCVEGD
jgi:uncharacterized Zn-binding protein involved in type VI secretion